MYLLVTTYPLHLPYTKGYCSNAIMVNLQHTGRRSRTIRQDDPPDVSQGGTWSVSSARLPSLLLLMRFSLLTQCFTSLISACAPCRLFSVSGRQALVTSVLLALLQCDIAWGK